MKITIYNEYVDFHKEEICQNAYPNGIHSLLKDLYEKAGHEVKVYTIDTINGIDDKTLKETDIMLWWGHCDHDGVDDKVAQAIAYRVNCGMGFIALHSAHLAKPFRFLMGTSCTLKWREINERERLWVVNPTHPIAEGLGEYVNIEHEEMYGEFFDIPKPDELVFIGWYQGGEVCRSGVCYNRGYGKVFYFQPGHETNRTYHQKEIQKILLNAANWAKPTKKLDSLTCPNVKELEKVEDKQL